MNARFAGFVVVIAACLALLASCSSRPEIKYYTVSPAMLEAKPFQGRTVLAVEQFTGDSAYEDTRMVYRESDIALDYYHYHRWTSPPAVMISDYLRVAYARSGLFRTVESGFSPEANVFLNGRIVAIEEVDVDDDNWNARVVIDMRLRNSRTGSVVWAETLSETEPIDEQNPAGLARAVSRAMSRIVQRTAPIIAREAEAVDRRQQQQEDQFLPTSPGEF
jgi:ABC-type uncharacterized transport system auxiliary subunit